MQRLTDIRQKDLDAIFTYYRDFMKQVTIQTGSEKLVVWCDLQSSDMEMSASEKPVNAYAITLYTRTVEIPKAFRKKLTKDAILYVESEAYKVIDVADDGGVFCISLERGTQRGASISGREL